MDGNAGADTLVGGAQNDILTGGDGVDYLYGGDDDDILIAQDTDGKIDGGANNLTGGLDVARFASSVSAVNLTNAKLVEIEQVEITNTLTDASYDFSAQTEALIIVGGSRADTITGTQDWDTFVVSATSDVDAGESYDGVAGTDTLSVADGTVDLSGLVSLTSVEVITLGSGAKTFAASALTGDTIAVSGTATLTVNGTAAGDTINLSGLALSGGITAATINGLDGDDVITGTSGADTITGGTGADAITVGAGANVIVIGNADSGVTVATADSIADFTAATVNFLMGVAGNATASTGNYVEVADADYAGNFAAILTALNTAAATLAATSSETELFVFAADTQAVAGVGATGYLGNDTDGNGTIDQVIILTGINNNGAISAADIIGSLS